MVKRNRETVTKVSNTRRGLIEAAIPDRFNIYLHCWHILIIVLIPFPYKDIGLCYDSW